jgi:AcrR family transcriptional regulator
VAAEAQLNIGSLRHYFTSQQELMQFAMQSMLDRVSSRLLRRLDQLGDLRGVPLADQRRRAVDLLAELLPLDENRRGEVMVFIDFTAAARTNPAYHELARQAALGTRTLIRQVLGRLQQTAAVHSDLDVPLETERLAALVDGLSITAALHPDILNAPTCLRIVGAHMEQLQPPAT